MRLRDYSFRAILGMPDGGAPNQPSLERSGSPHRLGLGSQGRRPDDHPKRVRYSVRPAGDGAVRVVRVRTALGQYCDSKQPVGRAHRSVRRTAGRQSVSATVAGAGECDFRAERELLQPSVLDQADLHAAMEPQPAAAGGRILVTHGQLSGQQVDPSLDESGHQSGSFHPGYLRRAAVLDDWQIPAPGDYWDD